MRGLWFVLWAVGWAGSAWAAEVPAGESAAEAAARWSHLELDARVAPGEGTIAGRAAWRYVNDGDDAIEAVQFMLRANLDAQPNPHLSAYANALRYWNAWEAAGTHIERVEVGGASARWRLAEAPATEQIWGLDDGVLVVELDAPLGPGEAVEIAIDFETRAPHRRWDEGRFNGDLMWRFGWFPQPRARAPGGWSDATYFTAFTHRGQITVPEGYAAVVGAERWAQEGAVARVESTAPVRTMPLVVSDRMRRFDRTIEGVEVSIWLHGDVAVFDPIEDEAALTAERVQRVLADFGPRYGAYRFERLHVVESPSTQTAMAADGMVLLSDLFFVYDDTLIADDVYVNYGEVVLAHELAHLWFGLTLGVEHDRDNWISEGLAQYAAYAFSERRFGRGGNDAFRTNWFVAWLLGAFSGRLPASNTVDHTVLPSYERQVRDGIDEPLALPAADVKHHEADAYRFYHKALLAFRAVEAWLGAEGFERVLARLYTERPGERVTGATLVEAARAEGVDLAPFVAGFVEGHAKIDLAIVGVEGGETGVQVRVDRRGALEVPAVVEVRQGESVERAVVPPGSGEVTVEVPYGGPRRGGAWDGTVHLDPGARVPDRDRRNNRWGDEIDWQWYAARPTADQHVIAVNPLHFQRAGLWGVSLAGASGELWRWDVGAGLLGLGFEADEETDEATTRYVTGGFASVAWALDREHTLGIGAEVVRYEADSTVDGISTQHFVAVGPTWSWAIYEATELGLPGVTELPRTVLSLGPRLRIYDVPQDAAWEGSDEPIGSGLGWSVELGVVRDERVTLGLGASLALAVGARPLVDGVDGLDAQYGTAALSVDYWRPVPYVGRFRLGVTGTALTPGGPLERRGDLARLPLAFDPLGGSFDVGGSGDVVWRIPLVRDRRIKNVLTLDVFVFNDLSLDVYYAAAVGGRWTDDEAIEAADALGEVGGAVVLGLAEFSGVTGDAITTKTIVGLW